MMVHWFILVGGGCSEEDGLSDMDAFREGHRVGHPQGGRRAGLGELPKYPSHSASSFGLVVYQLDWEGSSYETSKNWLLWSTWGL